MHDSSQQLVTSELKRFTSVLQMEKVLSPPERLSVSFNKQSVASGRHSVVIYSRKLHLRSFFMVKVGKGETTHAHLCGS